jgi:hypothetical protein
MFFDKESLLLWGINHHKRSVANIREALYNSDHHAEVFDVRSRREVDALVARLARERPQDRGAPALETGRTRI